MKKSAIRNLYYAGKESGLFTNIIPESVSGRGANWEKIYGSKKHNLPHGFYFGVIGYKLILRCQYNQYGPIWIRYDYINKKNPYTIPDIYGVSSGEKYWPYLLDERGATTIPKILTVEEVMKQGPAEISDFIIFNINLFG